MATNSGNSSDSKARLRDDAAAGQALDALRGRVAGFGEERLGELAVARGWLAEAALDGAIDMIDRGASPGPLLSLLVELKLLTREQVDELRGRLPAIEAGELAAPREPDLPMEVRLAREDPASHFGKFVLVQEVGHGGMGTVWRAWQSDLGRWVAVKRLHPEASKFLPRFLREGRLGAQIVHPNLVPIHEVGEIDGTPYLAMALIDGGSLENRRLPIRQAVEIAMAVAYAAHELHGVGIVHRDIKPGNIMIDRSGRAYLGDFSLACTEETAPGVSKSGLMLGTPAYAAPEQIRGERSRTGPRSDVYSLGATLFTLLTGEMPFTGADSFEIVAKALRGEPPPLRARRPEVNHQIQDIVWTAMRKEPEERYATALEFATDLKRYLDGETVHARPPGLVSRIGWTVTRHRRALAAAAAIAVMAAGVVGARRLSAGASRQRAEAYVGRAERAVAEAERLLQRGPASAGEAHVRLEEGARELSAALAEDRASARAQYWLGRIEALRGNARAAEAAFTEAMRLDASDSRARFERGRVRLEEALLVLLAMRPRPYLFPCCDPVSARMSVSPAAAWQPVESWERARRLYESARQDLSGDAGSFASPELASAYRALLYRRPDEAREICDRQLREGIPEQEFMAIRGLSHLLALRIGPARADFEALADRYRAYPIAHLGRSITNEDVEQAVEACSRAIALRPRMAVAWLGRGAWHLHLGRHAPAAEDLDRALALDPELRSARQLRVIVRLAAGDVAGAEAEWKPLDDGSADATWLRAVVHLSRPGAARGHAMELATRAIGVEPTHAPSLVLRMHLLFHEGRYDEALADLDRAQKEVAAQTLCAGYRASILMKMGRASDARDVLDRALEGPEKDVYCLHLRSVLRGLQGDVDGALADADEVLRMSDEFTDGYRVRCVLRAARRDWKGVDEDFMRYERLADKAEPAIRQYRALALANLGRHEESLAEYAAVVDAPGADPEWRAGRAEVLYHLGRHGEAAEEFTRAIERGASRPQVLIARARALMALGRRREAEADLDAAVTRDASLAGEAAEVRGK